MAAAAATISLDKESLRAIRELTRELSRNADALERLERRQRRARLLPVDRSVEDETSDREA